jgi:hypothetical protein
VAARKPKKTFAEKITFPSKEPAIQHWMVLGLDPSLSRTGYAFSLDGEWIEIGSLKPDDSSLPIWVRSKMIAGTITERLYWAIQPTLKEAPKELESGGYGYGLLVCMEVPTPRNDFLNIVSKTIHADLLPRLPSLFSSVHVLQINAATMRSNKSQEFADPKIYPGIDSDSCDAILFSKYGHMIADLLSPEVLIGESPMLLSLCDNTPVVKGKGKRAKIVTKGILHNPAYWYTYTPTEYSISLKDATIPAKKRLQKLTITI